jgi:hypothetical protein
MASGDEEPPRKMKGPVNLSGEEAPWHTSNSQASKQAEAFTRRPAGIWCKLPELSQQAEYEQALDLWEISGMQKATAKLIEGIEVHHQGSTFNVSDACSVPANTRRRGGRGSTIFQLG